MQLRFVLHKNAALSGLCLALLLCLLGVGALLPASGLHAQIWTGAVSNDFHNPANWNPNSVPGPGATVNIRNNTPYPVITQDVTVQRINISEFFNGGELSVTAGATLTVSSRLDINNVGRLLLDNGTLQFDGNGNGQNRINQAFTQTNIDIVNGGVLNTPNARLQINGQMTIDDGTLNAGDGFQLSSNKVMEVSTGTINLFGPADIFGTLEGGKGDFTFNGNLNSNQHEVVVRNGGRFLMDPTELTGGNRSYPSVSCPEDPVSDGGSLTFNIPAFVQNNGRLYAGNSDIVFSQPYTSQGNAEIYIYNGSVNFQDDTQFSNTASIAIDCRGSISISGDGTFQQNGNIDVGDGNFSVSGTATFQNSGTLNAGEANITFQDDVIIANSGGIMNVGASDVLFEGGTFENSGSFDSGTSTFTFGGNGTQTITGFQNDIIFYDLVVEGGADVISEQNVQVNNNMTVVPPGSFTNINGTTLNVVGDVIGDVNIDTPRPYIIVIEIIDSTTIRAIFDEALTPGPAETAGNYTVRDGIPAGSTQLDPINTNPTLGGTNSNEVTISLSNLVIQPGEEYFLHVSNVTNLNGDPVSNPHVKRFGIVVPDIFFSRRSGNWEDTSTWSTAGHTGAATNLTPAPGDAFIIANNDEVSFTGNVTNNEAVTVNDTGTLNTAEFSLSGSGSFTLEDGGTLVIRDADGITASGSSGAIRSSTRSFSEQASYIYSGASIQETGDGLPATVNELRVQVADTLIASNDLIANGGVFLESGNFRIPSGQSLVASTIDDTGGGSLTMQRIIDGGQGWRMLSSPLSTTYGDWLSGFVTQGFSGATFPNRQPNVLFFDESVVGTTNQAWRNIGSNPLGSNITAGRGYFLYVFGDVPGDADYTSALPKTLDVSGLEAAPGGSAFSFPLSYTPRDASNISDTDIVEANTGWNLIGNPTAATLDWDNAAWTRTNVDNSIYIWDAEANGGNGEYLVYNGITGTTPPPSASLIAPFQSFWVTASGPSPQLSFTDAAKTTGGDFVGDGAGTLSEEPPIAVLKMRLEHQESSLGATGIITLMDEGRLSHDIYDAYWLRPLSETYLGLMSVRTQDAMPLVIQNLPATLEEAVYVPVHLTGTQDGKPVSGTFSLHWEQNQYWSPETSLVLMDHDEKRAISMNEISSYTFIHDVGSAQKRLPNDDGPKNGALLPAVPAERPADLPSSFSTMPDIDKQFEATRFSMYINPQGDTTAAPEYIPRASELFQNYPNPFNPETTISFSLPERAPVELNIYDITGRRVATLANGSFGPGRHELRWQAGSQASGVYVYRLQTNGQVQSRTMLLLK